jgi:sugar (pentulose or hexulose) kinase
MAGGLLRELGLPDDLIAPRYAPERVMGAVTREAAEACGLRAGTPVVTGWHDFNCGLLGSGITAPGQGFDIGGTTEHVGVALGATGGPDWPDRLMLAPYLGADQGEARRVCYGVTSAGGGSLEWYGNRLVGELLRAHGLDLPDGGGERLAALAEEAPVGAGGLIFLPYLHGERAPIWDARARGVFFGLSGRHGHAHLARAVLEGVAYSLRQVLEAVEGAVGARVERVVVSGGPASLGVWNQIKADVLGRPVAAPRVTHAACLGAAMLAAVGVGLHANAARAAEAMVHAGAEAAPDPRRAARYNAFFALYESLYPRLRPAFAELAAIQVSEEDWE